MFGIGFVEICIIALVAIVFVGPKKLPEMMKQVGKFFVQAKKMSNEVKSTFDTVVKDAEQELHLENLAKIKELTKGALTNPLVDLNDAVNSAGHHDDHQHGHDDDHGHGDDNHHDNSHDDSHHETKNTASAAEKPNSNTPENSQPQTITDKRQSTANFSNIEETESLVSKEKEEAGKT